MQRARRGRFLTGLALATAFNAAVLGLAGLQSPKLRAFLVPPRPEPAVPVLLWPRAPRPRVERAAHSQARRPRRPEAAPPAAAQPAPAQAGAGTTAVAAGPGQGATAGSGGWPAWGGSVFRRIRPAIGCAHPEGYRLTASEQDRCDEALGKNADPWPGGPFIPREKALAYERALHCRRTYADNNTPLGPGQMGYIPSLRECPPGDR